MKNIGRISFLLSFLSFNLWAQSPLPVDADTVALLNFDSDVDSTVIDSATDPATCIASTTLLEPIPGIDPSFSNARRFGVFDSLVSCGQTQGSKFDFTNQEFVTVEALIYLENNAPSYHVIFDNGQLQLMVVGNKLAGFVKQQDGFVGTIADEELSLNQIYRVGYLINQDRLTLFVDGLSVSTLILNEPIAPPAFSTLNATFGGNPFGQFFPGYIDDIRISSIARLDGTPPVVSQIQPLPGTINVDPRPEFIFGLSDESSIDLTSVKVFLNGTLQSGLNVTNTQVSGVLEQDLRSDIINIVKVEALDVFGNKANKNFDIIYSPNSGGFEYETDASTLALYHMNDFSKGTLTDSSNNNRHAFTSRSNINTVLPADVVFGNGRAISPQADLYADSMTLSKQAFTFEGWFKPQADTSSSTLISTGQFKIERYLNGNIRVSIISKQTTYVYETPVNILPVGELHHLAVAWDGEADESNLRLYRDGVIAITFDAISRCDFDLRPVLSTLLSNYNGLVDEIRVSSVARVAFNVPTVKQPGINFIALSNLSSTLEQFPQLNVELNSFAGIDPQNVSVLLNGVDLTSSPELTITPNLISGSLSDSFTTGMNQLEVRYIDLDGNNASKVSNIFYIQNLGGQRNLVEDKTALLLNFDRGDLTDSSVNQVEFNESNAKYSEGLIGKILEPATSSSDVNLYSNQSTPIVLKDRAFTFEGFYKIPTSTSINTSLFSITTNGFSISTRVNSNNGSVLITGNTPVGSFSGTVASALPLDNNWHHIAFVLDESRDFANVLLFVDGQVKYVDDFNCACDFSDPLTINLSTPRESKADEIIITNEAKYSFNLNSQSKPILTAMNPGVESTVTSSNINISYEISDSDGMNNNVQLKVNGVLQAGLSVTPLGLGVELSGSVANLVKGVNEFELVYKDLLNNEQIKNFNVYYFEQLPAAEYVADSNTVMLFHMNELSGPTLVDSSGNNNDVNFAGLNTFAELGLFGTTGIRSNGYVYQSVAGLLGLSSYTMEMWLKTENVATFNFEVFKVASLGLRLNSGNLVFGSATNPNVFTINNFRNSSQTGWVHIALVVDEGTVFILADGNVIWKFSAPISQLTLNSNNISLLYSNGANNVVDEFRFSNIARYELISTQE